MRYDRASVPLRPTDSSCESKASWALDVHAYLSFGTATPSEASVYSVVLNGFWAELEGSWAEASFVACSISSLQGLTEKVLRCEWRCWDWPPTKPARGTYWRPPAHGVAVPAGLGCATKRLPFEFGAVPVPGCCRWRS